MGMALTTKHDVNYSQRRLSNAVLAIYIIVKGTSALKVAVPYGWRSVYRNVLQ